MPEDDKVITNSSSSISNMKYTINRAFEVLADNIILGEKKLFDCTYKYKGLLGTIKKIIKRSVWNGFKNKIKQYNHNR